MKVPKKLFGFWFLLFCFSVAVTCSGSPMTYQISEEQLTQLEKNLDEQEQLLNRLSIELNLLKLDSSEAKRQLITANQQLERAKSELTQSKNELQHLTEDLRSSQIALEKANKLFKEYEEQEKKTNKRLTRQRNLWIALLGSIASGLALTR